MSYTAFIILILIVAIALILIVMVQNPKGGGLSSSFGGSSSTIGGVQNTNSFLDRTTWTLAIALFALILLSNFAIDRGGNNNFQLKNKLENVNTSPTTNTDFPTKTNDSI